MTAWKKAAKNLTELARILMAGFFVYGCIIAGIVWTAGYYDQPDRPWWVEHMPKLMIALPLTVAMVVFNRSGYRPGFRRTSLEEHINELDAKGEISRESFQARRAFAVEEIEDEGSHYYVELVDGRVLYLNGQYLYDYEPIVDEPELNQARLFPCTEFVVLRHKQDGYVLRIECAGSVIEPEVTTAPFTRMEMRDGIGIPEDGEIFPGRPYDALKRRRLAAARLPS